MFQLYFGNLVTGITSLAVLLFLGYFALLFWNRQSITFWGRHLFLLAAGGLLICCLAATRDGYVNSVQNLIDGSTAPGLIPVKGFWTIAGGILALLAIVCTVLAIFLKNQDTRRFLFFLAAGGLTVKIIVMEISRIVLYLGGNTSWTFE